MKNKLNEKNIFENEPTRSILNLLNKFQDKENGLRQMHFKYALGEEYATKEQLKDPELSRNLGRLQDFFKDRLDFLFNNNFIKKGCINSRQHLSYYLKKLEALEAIIKKGERKNSRYKLSENFSQKLFRIENIDSLIMFPYTQIRLFSVETAKSNYTRHLIYGLPDMILKKLHHSEKDKINKNLEEIEKKLDEIEKIKEQIIFKEIGKRINAFFSRTKSQKIKELLKNRPGNLLGVIDTTLLINKQNVLTLPKNVIELSLKSWSKHSGKDYGFSLNDIKEMTEWGWENRDFFWDMHPMSIAFSRYCEY